MRLVGVYRADGGLVGEARYLLAHYLLGRHCTLCDITHSPFRRRAAWDEQVASLGIPFDLLHLNELSADQSAFVGDGAACVFSESSAGRVMLLDNEDLENAHGDITAFFGALRRALASVPDARG